MNLMRNNRGKRDYKGGEKASSADIRECYGRKDYRGGAYVRAESAREKIKAGKIRGCSGWR